MLSDEDERRCVARSMVRSIIIASTSSHQIHFASGNFSKASAMIRAFDQTGEASGIRYLERSAKKRS
jgi:hypothetical protein